MQIIKPLEISGKIMSLISEAKELLIIVSPYNKISNWDKFLNVIKKPQKRGINIEWYIRKKGFNDIGNGADEIKKLNIIPFEIEDLHAKIYLNEKNAIVSSMNLYSYSDTKSIDIGYITETHEEYLEVVDIVNEYIKRDFSGQKRNTISNDKQTKSNQNREIVKPNQSNLVVEKTTDDRKLEGLSFSIKQFINTNPILNKLELNFSNGRKGTVIKVNKFKDNYLIEFEINSSPRLILNILGDYRFRREQYKKLESMKSKLENETGFEIDFGNQMFRLKFHLNQEDENFSTETIIQRIDAIIQVLNRNLD